MPRLIGIGCGFLALLLLAQAYALIFHGIYFDCVAEGGRGHVACPRTSLGGPSAVSLLIGLAFVAGAALAGYAGFKAFRWRSTPGERKDAA